MTSELGNVKHIAPSLWASGFLPAKWGAEKLWGMMIRVMGSGTRNSLSTRQPPLLSSPKTGKLMIFLTVTCFVFSSFGEGGEQAISSGFFFCCCCSFAFLASSIWDLSSPESESEVAQLCPTLCDPMDCSLPGSSVHGILQARILEWVAISFSRGSSQHRDQTRVSRVAGRRFNLWATREARDQTCIPCSGSRVLTSGPPGNS